MSILFKNCDIYTNGKFLRNAYLGVDGRHIDYIGQYAPDNFYDEEKNMSGKLLIPGLVNAHTHTPMTLLRGVGTGLPLQKWLFNAIFPIEDKIKTKEISIGVQFALLEMLASGTTLYEDMYWDYNRLMNVVIPSGIKVNAGSVIQLNDPSSPDSIKFAERRLERTEKFYLEYSGAENGRIMPNVQVHSEYLMNDEFASRASELAHKYNMEVHVHISETKKEHEECIARHNMTPIEYMNKMGLLDTGAVCAHCVWVTDNDLDIMHEKNASIAHNPESNLKLGSGVARIPDAIKHGVNVALGTDGVASNNNLNMFEEMHVASILHAGVNNDPLILGPKECFDMATVNGAKALHRPETGVLEVGKCADIVALDMDKPHLLPDVDTMALLTYSVQAADVCMTMVDGRILYENGEYYSLDADKVKHDFLSITKNLYD